MTYSKNRAPFPLRHYVLTWLTGCALQKWIAPSSIKSMQHNRLGRFSFPNKKLMHDLGLFFVKEEELEFRPAFLREFLQVLMPR